MTNPRNTLTPIDAGVLSRWRIAIFATFAVAGLSVTTWASRVPAIKDELQISRVDVGVLLLFGGIFSIVGLSLAGVILARYGARVGVVAGISVAATGIAVVGLSAEVLGSYALACVGMSLWGLGMGSSDVMINVEGAAIEQHTGRTLLPLFHAMFSVGTAIGAGLGVLAINVGIDPAVHLVAVSAFMILAVVTAGFAIPKHLPDTTVDGGADAALSPAERRAARRERFLQSLSAWREPRTYAIGVIMLGMAFAEGGATDWLPLAVVEGHHFDDATGAAALTVFTLFMAAGRVVGGPVVDRVGRVVVLRVLAVIAASGLLLFLFTPNLPLLFVGAALWGLGASLGFPLGMSAAADDPEHAAARVAAAATIGYIAFLAGPPLLGFISEGIGILPTLGIIVVLIVLSGFFSGAARPLATSRVGGQH